MELEALLREADPANRAEPAEAGSDLAQMILDEILAGRGAFLSSTPEASSVSRRSSVNNRHGVRGLSIVAAAVILIVALGAVFIARDQGQGNGSSNVSLRPNPNTKPILMNWRLVSSVSPGVHPFVSTGGNPQGLSSLTCPSTQVCYLIAGTISGVRNAADRSIDGGMTWSPLTLPAGVLLDTSFSCVSDAECMIGAHDGFGTAVGGSNVPQLLLTTKDGGATWTTQQVPMPPITGVDSPLNQAVLHLQGSLYDLHCFTSTTCIAFGTTPADQQAQPTHPKPADPSEPEEDTLDPISQTVAMRTNDGGRTWSTYVFPWSTTPNGDPGWSSEQTATFSCATDHTCVGLATVLAAPNDDRKSSNYGDQAASLLEYRSTDGGVSWTSNWVPETGSADSLSCLNRSHCFAVTEFGALGAYGAYGVLTSTDGGATWTAEQPFPTLNPGWDTITSITCPTSASCWISGYEQSTSHPSDSQGAMFTTKDGGQTWLPVELPVGLGIVNQVDCPTVQSCLAIGQPPIPNGPVTSHAPTPSLFLTNRP